MWNNVLYMERHMNAPFFAKIWLIHRFDNNAAEFKFLIDRFDNNADEFLSWKCKDQSDHSRGKKVKKSLL